MRLFAPLIPMTRLACWRLLCRLEQRSQLGQGLVLVVLASFLATAGMAQTGPPLFDNFTPEDYQAGEENYRIVQDSRGLIYVANEAGVLEFDGLQWRKIRLPGQKPALVLARSDSGRVYVGSENEFGYLAPDSLGRLRYVSLAERLQSGQIGRIRTIRFLQQGVYFASQQRVYRWHDDKLARCQLHEKTKVQALRQVLPVPGRNLFAVERNHLRSMRLPQGVKPADVRSYMPYEEGRALMATAQQLLLYNGSTYRTFSKQAADFLANNVIADVAVLSEERIAVATLRGGVIFLNSRGGINTILNRASGLSSETVHGLWLDQQGGLWLALERGLARAEVNSPLSAFDEDDGLKGGVNQVQYRFNTLYVATQRGLYFLNTSQPRAFFQPVQGIVANAWALGRHGQHLYTATSNGLYRVEGDSAQRIYDQPLTDLRESLVHRGRMYLGTPSGLAVFYPDSLKNEAGKKLAEIDRSAKKTDEKLRLQADSAAVRPVQGLDAEVNKILEDRYGRLWLETSRGIYYLRFEESVDSLPQIRYLSLKRLGLPEGPARLFRAFGRIVVGTNQGLYKFNTRKWRFQPDSVLGEKGLNHAIYHLYQQRSGDVILSTEEGLSLGEFQGAGEGFEWRSRPFQRFPDVRGSNVTRVSGRKTIYWIGNKEGLLRFDPTIQPSYDTDFYTLLRRVQYGAQDSLLFGGTFRGWRQDHAGARQDSVSIAYSQLKKGFGRIRFDYAAPAFDKATANHYRYQLEGWDSSWSQWTTTTRVEYNNLPVGQYTFKVQARNIYGELGAVAAYRFEIEPLWYQTQAARVGFGVGGLLLLALVTFGAVKLNSYRLERQNRRLQEQVEARTREIRDKNRMLERVNAEIREQKEQIEEDKRVIEDKNEEITESMNYAFRIQEALLPSYDYIHQYLPASFVFWKPKDIVSGDFFWFAQVGERSLITAADCTGHGIPGAFMTVVGDTLLNQIVREEGITMPDQILNELHKGVRRALKQDETSSRDGMDMALITVDHAAGQIYFAGAENPLVLVREGEAHQYKADKQAIGGEQLEEERVFSCQTITYQPGDVFYMFSDGLQDQFGGPEGKKFMKKNLRKMLQAIATQPPEAQREHVDRAMTEWMADYEQVDDMILVGVKIPEGTSA
jgi:serine phosphatase RsbU (regulator of sigma subunit)